MTPTNAFTVNFKEIKSVEIACECGAAMKLPLPLKMGLPDAFKCASCDRVWWHNGSPMRQHIATLVRALENWQGLEQPVLNLQFALTPQ